MADMVVVKKLPMYINLGLTNDFQSYIGWADVIRDDETGCTKIEIRLDYRSSELLGDMTKLFDLYAIGFAGRAKRSTN